MYGGVRGKKERELLQRPRRGEVQERSTELLIADKGSKERTQMSGYEGIQPK